MNQTSYYCEAHRALIVAHARAANQGILAITPLEAPVVGRRCNTGGGSLACQQPPVVRVELRGLTEAERDAWHARPLESADTLLLLRAVQLLRESHGNEARALAHELEALRIRLQRTLAGQLPFPAHAGKAV